MWTDIACIVFVCVTMNHLGLISAIEDFIGMKLPIIGCPKCLSCWVTMAYCFGQTEARAVTVLAISFLASYIALWLELFEGFADTLYMKIYGKIITTSNNDAVASDVNDGDSAGTVSEL